MSSNAAKKASATHAQNSSVIDELGSALQCPLLTQSGHSRQRLEADGASARDRTFRSKGPMGASCQTGNARRKSGELSAARHPRERLGVDENSAIIIERTFGVVSITRNLLNQFAIRLENSRICTGKMSALGMILAAPHGSRCTPLCYHPYPP